MTAQANGTRRRGQASPPPSNGVPPGTKEINAASMLENPRPSFEPGGKMTVSRAIAMAGIMVHSALPTIASWGMIMGLIFGGCCSNVRGSLNKSGGYNG